MQRRAFPALAWQVRVSLYARANKRLSLSDADLPAALPPIRQEPQTQLQFVNSAGPESFRKSDTKRLIRAHAARAAHSKIRRARIAEYQQAKPSQDEIDEVSIPGPVTLLGSGRVDPFGTYAIHCTAFEHALIDHCKGFISCSQFRKAMNHFLSSLHFIFHANLFPFPLHRAELPLRCPLPHP